MISPPGPSSGPSYEADQTPRHHLTPVLAIVPQMPTNDRTTLSSPSSNFTLMFDVAVSEYQRLTKQDLYNHPFTVALSGCTTPDDVLGLIRRLAEAFKPFREGEHKLMRWLNPIVEVLFMFSATLREGIGLPFSPAKVIFTAIGLLLGATMDVTKSYDTITDLFERVQFFLLRLRSYTGLPLTVGMTELLGKVMAQTLLILALSTKAMKAGRIRMLRTRVKNLTRRRDIQNAFQSLESFTRDEGLMMAARTLDIRHTINGNVVTIKEVTDVDNEVRVTEKWSQIRRDIKTWLAPPNSFFNHFHFYSRLLYGTAKWFTQNHRFDEWKKSGSLLWICGDRGSGKSVLCSAVIEDIKRLRFGDDKSAFTAYHYFDFNDAAKHDLRGLLSSLLMQLGEDSPAYMDVLHKLYTTCGDGSERPTEPQLARCLESILALPSQTPTYILIDALDECPSTSVTPPFRQSVLDFVMNLVGRKHPGLRICITSRAESDIKATLTSFPSELCCVSLHEELGQKKAINDYIEFFVHSNEAMQSWKLEDQELVITTLKERASRSFQHMHYQLDALSQCLPANIHETLNELPTDQEDAYKETLQKIPGEIQLFAYHLLQCLVAALRPLRVIELAQILTVDFNPDAPYTLVEDWRERNRRDDVLFACSCLIPVIDGDNGKVVQLSHTSVKRFLTSDSFSTSDVINGFHYYISLDEAHFTLARACLTVLLQMDEETEDTDITGYPLVSYAAQHWANHVKFGTVGSRTQIRDAMRHLFEAKDPYFYAWIRARDFNERGLRERAMVDYFTQPEVTPLYCAAILGFHELAQYLIVKRREGVNTKCGGRGTSLHAASSQGHLDIARLLLGHFANPNSRDGRSRIPLRSAFDGGHLDIMALLLQHGADVDARDGSDFGSLLHDASYYGREAAVRLLLQHEADVDARGLLNRTPVHLATGQGHTKIVRLLLENGANVKATDSCYNTPLDDAEREGHRDIVELLQSHGAMTGTKPQ